MECTINGESFTIEEGPNGFYWEHNLPGTTFGIIEEGGPFSSDAVAQQAAMAYVREFEKAQKEAEIAAAIEEAEAEDEARYGTYEQQVRDTYYANCM